MPGFTNDELKQTSFEPADSPGLRLRKAAAPWAAIKGTLQSVSMLLTTVGSS
jgi:hypothetical protein